MPTDAADDLLNERAQQLLKILIESYIRDGQPVGSRTLSRDVRPESQLGDHPQCDGGPGGTRVRHLAAYLRRARVPTDKGYRFFVDTLLKSSRSTSPKSCDLQRRLGEHGDEPQSAGRRRFASAVDVTHLAGVVTLPRQAQAALSQIEFLPLSDNRVLAILVVNGREVQNRILQLERLLHRRRAAARRQLPERAIRGQDLERGPRRYRRATAARLARTSTS